jgi:hypothetical protein
MCVSDSNQQSQKKHKEKKKKRPLPVFLGITFPSKENKNTTPYPHHKRDLHIAKQDLKT